MSRLTLNCVEDVQCRTEHSVCDLGSQQCICENGYHEVLDTHECLQNYGKAIVVKVDLTPGIMNYINFFISRLQHTL